MTMPWVPAVGESEARPWLVPLPDPPALMSTLVDAFDSFNEDLWTQDNMTFTDGAARMHDTLSASLIGDILYEFDSVTFEIQVPEGGDALVGVFSAEAGDLFPNSLYFSIGQDGDDVRIVPIQDLPSDWQEGATLPYVWGTRLFLRIRQGVGVIHYEYSSNGSMWTIISSLYGTVTRDLLFGLFNGPKTILYGVNVALAAVMGTSTGTRVQGQHRTYEIQGLLLNGQEIDGSYWIVDPEASEGWDGSPEIRLSGQNKPAAHGGVDGISYFGSRSISLQGFAQFSTRAEMLIGKQRISAIGTETEDLFTILVNDPDEPEMVAFVRLADGTKTRPMNEGILKYSMQFIAPDPRKYSSTEQVFDFVLPLGSTGGFFAPFSAPFFADEPVGGVGTATVYNEGNFETYPSVTVTGPVTNPALKNLTTGKRVALNFDLPAGEFIEFDFLTKSIMLGGTASRTGSLEVGSEWWSIVPGANGIEYTAYTGTDQSTMTVRFRSAWIG